MIKLEKTNSPGAWLRLYQLYRQAFPAEERKPFSMIRKMYRRGVSDVWCAMEGSRFVGLAITINSPQVILLDYLAVRENCRDRGVGTAILNRLKELYPGRGLFVEIENPFLDGTDREKRLRRKAFYQRWGMEPMGVMIWLFGVEMELLGYNCKLTYDQYYRFYHDCYTPWAAKHIQASEYPKT